MNDQNPNALQHTESLLCYKARHRVSFPTLEPFIDNYFGAEQVTLTRRMEFCVPSVLVPN